MTDIPKPQEQKQPKENYNTSGLKAYAKYSTVAWQMLASLVLGVFGGNWLDDQMENETPWFTVGLTFLGIIASLYLVIKKVKQANKD